MIVVVLHQRHVDLLALHGEADHSVWPNRPPMCKEQSVRSISSRALPLGRINSIVLVRLSDQEQSMAIDFSTVNWLYVAIMAVFAFVASLLGGLISFRNRIGGALLAAILFAAMYVVWNYYPHPQIQLPIVTAYSTPSGG